MFHYWGDGTPQAHVFSFQLTWLFSEAFQGAADTNELFRAARAIRSGNREDWYSAFAALGEQLQGIADDALANGHEATASEHYFRAFTYFRSSERVLHGGDARKPPMYQRAMHCWREGIALSLHPHANVMVPFEGHELEGWLFLPRQRVRATPPPCVLFLAGADALPEENFFRGVQYVTNRGAACFVFNGPGQGSTLRLLNLPTRPDYEKPVSAAIDVLAQRPEVDADRIGLLGVSMAGYYGPRAACFEPRIKACVAWGALYDVLNDLYLYYPPLQPQLRWIAGCASDAEARDRYKSFTLRGLLHRIRCPVLITHGVRDRMVPLASAQRTFDELNVSDKALRLYDDQEGGAEHCSMDNWSQVIPYQVDWLLDRLHR
jgi:dienelactone hydrolase